MTEIPQDHVHDYDEEGDCRVCDRDLLGSSQQAAAVVVVTEATGTKRRYSADGIDIDNGALVLTRGDDADNVAAAYAPSHWVSAHDEDALAPGVKGDPKGRALYIAVSALTDIADDAVGGSAALRAIARQALGRAAEAHPGLLS